MNPQNILNLPTEVKKEIIDYVEGLPSNINVFVKRNLSNTMMSPSIYRGKVSLHKTSTLRKYFTNINDTTTVSDVSNATYQSEFGKVMTKIEGEKRFPYIIQKKLLNLVMMESYDETTMIKVELEIGRMLEEYGENSGMSVLMEVINDYVLPYKLRVYDLYQYLLMDVELKMLNENYMVTLHKAIMAACNKPDSKSADISVLIYIYLKELGASNLFPKYPVLHRFKYTLLQNDKEDYISDVFSKLTGYATNHYTVTDALKCMFRPEDYTYIFQLKKGSQPEDGTHNLTERDYVFFLNHITELRGFEEQISLELKALTTQVIVKDSNIPDITPNHISTSLTDNDYGHLLHLENMEAFGTAYSTSGDMKYIGKHKGDFYLFFKVRTKPNTIVGISILPINKGKDRKIMMVNTSKKYYYQYFNIL